MRPREFASRRILVVDDEAPQRAILGSILSSNGWEVVPAASAEEALRRLDPPPDVVLTDLKMAGKDGLALLADLRRIAPETAVILMTAHGSIDTAVQAMKEGAFDYLTKPLSKDELLIVLERAIERSGLVRRNRELSAELARRIELPDIVAGHGAMQAVLRLVAKVAPSTSTVLIRGETGTGKELIARAIHQASRKAEGPFLALNCSAIPPALLESELFGHEKGSFTGAIARRIGLVEQAVGGTLFLDEVGDLPLELQPKLLRLLQEREILRVGGNAPISVDIRVVAATHRDLSAMMSEGRFREDLYWRLDVFPIDLPPLRERRSDIPALIEHFLDRLARLEGHTRKHVAADAMRILIDFGWPGNVRQLQSVVERASLLAEGDEIRPDDLPAEIRSPRPMVLAHNAELVLPEEGFRFEDFERRLLAQAMERSGHVIAKAAKMLGMSYRTMQYRLEKFGLRGGAGPEDGADD